MGERRPWTVHSRSLQPTPVLQFSYQVRHRGSGEIGESGNIGAANLPTIIDGLENQAAIVKFGLLLGSFVERFHLPFPKHAKLC